MYSRPILEKARINSQQAVNNNNFFFSMPINKKIMQVIASLWHISILLTYGYKLQNLSETSENPKILHKLGRIS